MRVLGIMSGTSADGADLVLAEFTGSPRHLGHRVLRHLEVPYPEALRARVLAAMRGASTREVALLHHDLGRFYAEAALPFRGEAELVGLSGQTLWHEPPQATFQIGEPSYLAGAWGCPWSTASGRWTWRREGKGPPWWPIPTFSSSGRKGSPKASTT